jgi:hypothetical protein
MPGFESCAFPSPEAAAHAIPETSWRPPADLPVDSAAPVGRRYFWRVRACHGETCSAWSAVRYVDVGRVPGDVNGDGWSDFVVGWGGTAETPRGTFGLFFGSTSPDDAADLVFEAPDAPAWLGPLVPAGDVNADGYADLLAPAGDAEDVAGAVFVFFGGASPDTSADLALRLSTPEANVPYAAGVGDIDGDGYDDMVVILVADVAEGIESQAFAYLGGGSPDGLPDLTYTPPVRYSTWWRAAGTGDVNGDGYADFVLAAPGGRVANVYFGGAAPDAAEDLRLQGSDRRDEFGSALAAAGDANGDGYADFLVGAHWDTSAGPASGRAYLFLGGAAPDAAADLFVGGTREWDLMGHAVAAGDIDADGYSDLIVGCPRFDLAVDDDTGRLLVLRGGAVLDPTPELSFDGHNPGDEFAVTAASGGMDVNGDGYADYVVGAHFHNTGGEDAGRAYLLFGGATFEVVDYLMITGTIPGARLGHWVACAAPHRAAHSPRRSPFPS